MKRPKYGNRKVVVDGVRLDGNPCKVGILALRCPPPSLNNAFVNGKKGRFKSAAYKTWITLAHLDMGKSGPWHVAGPVKVRILYGRSDTKADLDNLIKPILDALVSAGRIEDDRNVAKIEAEFDDRLGVMIEIASLQTAKEAA